MNNLFEGKEYSFKLVNDKGDDRAIMDFQKINEKIQLDDLWFFTGSKCNLSCSHCYVNSSPTNDLIQQISFEEFEKIAEEAVDYGLKTIYFTGGEPFINIYIIKILKRSLELADTVVLSNATYPISRYINDLKELKLFAKKSFNHSLKFRISIDHFDQVSHDKIRGKGMFNLTKNTINNLILGGFKPIVTVSAVVYENNDLSQDDIKEKFYEIFDKDNIEVKLLPQLEMGRNNERFEEEGIRHSNDVFITKSCMEGKNKKNFQCFNGRTVMKIDDKLRIYPCPIIYDDNDFELSTNTLEKSFKKFPLGHKACFDFCYKCEGSCTNN